MAIAASLKDADRMALVDPHLAAGIDRLRTGRYDEAVMALTAVTAEYPDSASAHFLLGEAYRGAGLRRAAIVAFREALRHDADMASAWSGLGSCLLREGDLERAERALREAIRFDPANAVARNHPPRVERVRILPDDATPGTSVTAEVSASDPDGDPLEFTYRWQLDGHGRIRAALFSNDETVAKATVAAMRDAAAGLLTEFETRPELRHLLQAEQLSHETTREDQDS